MIKIFVTEIGWLTIRESIEDVIKDMASRAQPWLVCTVVETYYGEMAGKKWEKERAVMVRKDSIILIEEA